VSHPFFTMAVTLEGVIACGLDDIRNSVEVAPFADAYLEPFTSRGSRASCAPHSLSHCVSAGSAERSPHSGGLQHSSRRIATSTSKESRSA
jgi:hypothetical protein